MGACLPLYRPLFAGVSSRGFMRDLQSVEVPTTEQSKTLWNNPDDSRAVEEWNSSISTMRYGSGSQPDALKEKGFPSLPASSLKMLSNAPNEGPWMKGPKVYHNMCTTPVALYVFGDTDIEAVWRPKLTRPHPAMKLPTSADLNGSEQLRRGCQITDR
ncbi:MAG: hypothetical protein Q9168_000178 [Polycauliona sp. 1 TL-2023]